MQAFSQCMFERMEFLSVNKNCVCIFVKIYKQPSAFLSR
jgi:hypothetical protein